MSTTVAMRQPPDLSLVIPTRNEAANIAPLLRRLDGALAGLRAEIIFMDDSSDHTPDVIDAAGAVTRHPVRLRHRPAGDRAGGLGGAVLEGFRLARAAYAVVMDADLQHPPESVPTLYYAAVDRQADAVIASRYHRDGSAAGLSTVVRRAVSSSANVACRLVFPRKLRGVTDAMSGFFLVRLATIDLETLRPNGYKVLLETLVRSRGLRVTEVAFTFAERHAGESKASIAEGIRFGRHLLELRLPRAVRFALVGATGVAPNLLAMAGLTAAGMHYLFAAVIATQVANAWNFAGCELLVWPHGPGARRHRFLPFAMVNSTDLPLRMALLAVLVDRWHIGVVVATLLSLLAAFAVRFALIDRLVYGRIAYPGRWWARAVRRRRPSTIGAPEGEPQIRGRASGGLDPLAGELAEGSA